MDINEKEINFCPTCNSMVEIGVLFKYNSDEYINPNDDLRGGGTELVFSKCLNCKEPFLKQIVYKYIFEDFEQYESTQLYPKLENSVGKNCPSIVYNSYQEAIKCFRAQAYDACVIMCRKGIEAICFDKGEEKGNLNKKLENLKLKGILEATLNKWADELRLIGNDGAHSHVKIVSQQDAKDAIDFFDSLITYLYHLVYQYEELIKRRKK